MVLSLRIKHEIQKAKKIRYNRFLSNSERKNFSVKFSDSRFYMDL